MQGIDWVDLATTSHYQTAVAIREALNGADLEEAKRGTEELIDALSRAEKRALRSQLIRLMLHIMKWKTQVDYRSVSWPVSILSARHEIADIQEDTPSLTRKVIEGIWEKCFKAAKEYAEAETGQKVSVKRLTWYEVFDKDYRVP